MIFRKIIMALIIMTVYIGLPILILVEVVAFEHKFIALTVGGLFVYVISRFIGFTNSDLGITLVNTKKAIIKTLPFTIILLISTMVVYILGFSRISPNESTYFFLFYILVSCPIQEFLYRGNLTCYLIDLKCNSKLHLLITSALYSFVHIIYRDIFTLVATFVIGIIWYLSYRPHKNLIGVSFSHIVLGIATIVTGIID